MDIEHEVRITRITVLPKGDDLWSEQVTEISIEDEGGGEFLIVRQNGIPALKGEVRIDPEEWLNLSEVISEMILLCKPAKP